jgi:hypothetical protein
MEKITNRIAYGGAIALVVFLVTRGALAVLDDFVFPEAASPVVLNRVSLIVSVVVLLIYMLTGNERQEEQEEQEDIDE